MSTTTTTIYDICTNIRSGRYVPKVGRPSNVEVGESVAAGLARANAPTKTGLVQLTPEQAASVCVEVVDVNGSVTGYQRHAVALHAKKIADALTRGEDVGEVTLALDGGKLYATDGQHRLIASVIARKPVWAVIRPMALESRAQRFASQNKARRVSADNIVLAGSDPVSLYVKEAIASGAKNPWSGMVGERTSDKFISPSLAASCISAYTRNAFQQHGFGTSGQRGTEKFTRSRADEFFGLVSVFGTKTTNPLAFRPFALRAITNVAILAVRRADDPVEAQKRWMKHMQSFDWAGYAWLKTERDLRTQLAKHWNKRISKKIAES